MHHQRAFRSLLPLLALTVAGLGTTPARATAFDVAFSPGAHEVVFDSTTDPLAGGSDVITFKGLASGRYDFVLTVGGPWIQLSGASLNGIGGTLLSSSVFSFAGIVGSGSPEFVLTLTGSALAAPPGFAPSYLGRFSVSPTAAVPEPETAAFALAGLAVAGGGWWRRRREGRRGRGDRPR